MYEVYKLHLELNTENADIDVLNKYGMVKNGISRDVYVLPYMTLHALNYLIQKLFGWRNSHLHHFMLPDEKFFEITENSFMKWTDFCGVYFRMPNEDFEDIYWDDDFYESDLTPKEWFRSKYNDNYEYHGVSEHYMEAQYLLNNFLNENKKIGLVIPFDEWSRLSKTEQKKPKYKATKDLTAQEAEDILAEMGGIKELLERLTVEEIFGSSEPTKVSNDLFIKNQAKFIKAHNKYIETGKESSYYKVLNPINPKASPITDTLFYEYDYGDGWSVKITLVEIAKKHILKPKCAQADGLPVLDDVGGIGGYCDMLKILNNENNLPEEEILSTEFWAKSMGWNGKMCKLENML